MMTKCALPKLTKKMRANLRRASTEAQERFSIGGVEKTKRPPKPITLRNFEKKADA